MVKKSRPFFTCRQPREGIEGILPDKGCRLPSPNRSPPIGINKRIKQWARRRPMNTGWKPMPRYRLEAYGAESNSDEPEFLNADAPAAHCNQ